MTSSTYRAASNHAIVGSTQHLSRFETLPTELVEHIGSYLIHDTVGRYSICALRIVSKTAKAKLDYTFRACFTVKVVYFDMYSLTQLLLMSFSEMYKTSIRVLVFAEDARYTIQSHPKECNESLHEIVAARATAMELPSQQATPVLLMMIAFAGLSNLTTIKIDSSLQHYYSSSTRQSSLAKHPPSMILAAAITSGVSLEKICMRGQDSEPMYGLKPRILNSFLSGLARLDTLRSVDLMLTSRNSGTDKPALGVGKLLEGSNCLEYLSLTMDTASIAETAPQRLSDMIFIWRIIKPIILGKLRVLRLTGWELFGADIETFLSNHNNTLRQIILEDCILFGSWRAVLSVLANSASLRMLDLVQISLLFFRLHFPTTSHASSIDMEEDDWQWVGTAKHMAGILPCEDWNSKLEEIIDDMTWNGALVDPNAPDAEWWE